MRLRAARNMLPVSVPAWTSQATLQGGALVVVLSAPEGVALPTKARFFPERENLIEPAAPQKVTRQGNRLRFEMRLAEPVLKE